MKIIWQDEALDDLDATLAYISEENPQTAYELVQEIFTAVELNLPDNPNMGRPGRVEGTRELIVHKNYIAVYQVSVNQIDVLTIRHAARLWPEKF